MHHQTQSANMQLNNLIEFRQAAYHQLGRAKDAQFELSDALMLTHSLPSLAHLSLSPMFRRRWPSVYEGLQDGTPDREGLLRLYTKHLHSSSYPALNTPRVLLAGDHTVWPRPLARTLPERTYLHQPPPIPGLGGKPVTAGHGYSTLSWIPEHEGSWALPHPRQVKDFTIKTGETTCEMMIGIQHQSSSKRSSPCLILP